MQKLKTMLMWSCWVAGIVDKSELDHGDPEVIGRLHVLV